MAEKITEFKFLVPVAKAVEGDNGELFVDGVASSTNRDSYGTVISRDGQRSMAAWANTGEVVLGGEADHFAIAFDDDLGRVTRGEVLDNGDFYVQAQLDADNPRAVHLHKKLRQGTQLGLSVFGTITKSHLDDDGTPIIDGVRLSRIMVTKRPANPDTWLDAIAKSLASGDALEDETHEADEALAEEGVSPAASAPDASPTDDARPADAEGDEADEADALADEDGADGDGEQEVIARPEPREDETRDEFLERCIPEVQDDGAAESQEQAVAICHSMWDAAHKAEPVERTAPTAPASSVASDVDASLRRDQIPTAVRVARSFAQAVEMMFQDDEIAPDARRAGMQEALATVARRLDEALPAPQPDEGDEPPAWAAELMAEVKELRTRIEEVAAAKQAEAGDTAQRAQRKTQPPTPNVRPSRNVAKARTFAEIVDQMFFAGSNLPELP